MPATRSEDRSDDDTERAAARRRGDVARTGRAGDELGVRAALGDPHSKVRVAALAALVRMERATPGDIAALARDADPVARRGACELAVTVPGSPVTPCLEDLDPSVVEAAAFAAGELELVDAVPALVTIALSHPERLCRESAVAALGAIGDDRGRAAVIEATRDAPAIRRRAVVALAAFSGGDVESALRDRLEDRDWQVRQAAEDVLGLSDEEPR
ncbi:MAG TPA: HEAT repeat domain-containing protein [Acidimicrobiales bacterium]|nr:HEAT repeat domain-containing protein [Acidimicrobiales bacterium]